MKRFIALLFAVVMVLSLAACGEEESQTYSAVGESLVDSFEENKDKSAQEIADALVSNPNLGFMGTTMGVEEGVLTGFGNAEIKGFDEGVMFGVSDGTVPFIGYVFTLSDDTDVDKFKDTLKDNADLSWNNSAEADELIVESEGNKVVVIITPTEFDAEGEVQDQIIEFTEAAEEDYVEI